MTGIPFMKTASERRHTAEILFPLLVISIFAVCALVLIRMGAENYAQIEARIQERYTSGTAASYVTEKIRQNDNGEISVQQIEGRNCLVLCQTINSREYRTYIYTKEHTLCELFAAADADVELSAGTPILEVEEFTVEQIAADRIRISSTGDRKAPVSTVIALRAGQ